MAMQLSAGSPHMEISQSEFLNCIFLITDLYKT